MQFSGSRVFSETFRVVKERFGPLLGILVSYWAIQIVVVGVLLGLFGGILVASIAAMNPQGGVSPGLGAGAVIGLIVAYLALILLGVAQNASLCAIASPLRSASFGDGFRDGLRAAPTLFGVVVLGIVAYMVVGLLVGLVMAGLVAALGTTGAVISTILLFAGLLYVAGRLIVLVPVVAVERIGNPITVISRTWALTGGNVFKILLITLAFMLVAGALFGVAFMPMFSAITQAQLAGTVPDFSSMGTSFLLLFVVGIVMSLVGSAFQSVLHAELAGDSSANLDDTFA